MARNSHCTWCGHPYQEGQEWPRLCAECGQISYLNPLPVAVLLVPVADAPPVGDTAPAGEAGQAGDGVLVVRRNIDPGRGKLALPGGFIDVGESWQRAAARELVEETGVVVDPDDVRLYDALSAPDGTLLVFGICSPVPSDQLPASVATAETTGWEILRKPEPLAFPLHTTIVDRYFA